MSAWIKVSNRLPPASFVESDDDDLPYEAIPVLLCLPDRNDHDLVVGIYEETVLDPFPNIGIWKGWNGENWSDLPVDPSHWMPLPDFPKD